MAGIRFKDLTKTLTYAQWLASFSPADSAANGTGKILGQTIVDNILNQTSTMQIQTFGSGALTAFPGIFYIASSISDLVLTLAPSIGGEYHLKFTTAATIGTIDLSSVTSWIGSAPSIAAGKTYEWDILDGVGVIAEVS